MNQIIMAIANEFSARLRDELGDDVVDKITTMNAAESNRSVCHSHDFCDAGMVMVAAFEDVMGDYDADQVEMLDQAWDAAKANGFREIR